MKERKNCQGNRAGRRRGGGQQDPAWSLPWLPLKSLWGFKVTLTPRPHPRRTVSLWGRGPGLSPVTAIPRQRGHLPKSCPLRLNSTLFCHLPSLTVLVTSPAPPRRKGHSQPLLTLELNWSDLGDPAARTPTPEVLIRLVRASARASGLVKCPSDFYVQLRLS